MHKNKQTKNMSEKMSKKGISKKQNRIEKLVFGAQVLLLLLILFS